MEGYLGEIRMFAGNFAPRGWMLCNGQTLPISQYDAVYFLLGTTYGGDGQQNFNLPNLNSSVPVGTGQGPGLSNYVLAATGGSEANTLTAGNLPIHSHPLTGVAGILSSGEDGHKVSPVNNSVAGNGDLIYSTVTDNVPMSPAVVALTTTATGNQAPLPIPNIKPVLAINFIICLEGIFPSQP